MAVRQNGLALQYASKSIKSDPETVLAAVKCYGEALQYADKSLRADRRIVSVAVKQDGDLLSYAAKSLQNDATLRKIAGINNEESPATVSASGSRGQMELKISGSGFELVAGHIDANVVEQINPAMEWDEIEEIVGHWSEYEDILHEYWPDAAAALTCEEGKRPKLRVTNTGINKTKIKGKGYMMITTSFEEGYFGSVIIPAGAKDLVSKTKIYQIGDQELKALVGFSCGDEELEIDMSESSTSNTFTEIHIYNRENGKLLWPH
jgi:hypothetical protein